MTGTLKATEAMQQSLVKTQLIARAASVRAWVEADPEAGQEKAMDAAEHAIRNGAFKDAGIRMNLIERSLANRVERLQQAHHDQIAAEQEALLAVRGMETIGEPGQAKARDGFLWLVKKKRLPVHRIDIGQRFSNLYGRAMTDGLSSSGNDNSGGGDEDPIEARIKARERLDGIEDHIAAATGARRLFDLLTAVCGRGDTLRELASNDDRKAAALEVELNIALDMAGVRMGVIKV